LETDSTTKLAERTRQTKPERHVKLDTANTTKLEFLNETAEAREARLARNRQYQRDVHASSTPKQRQERSAIRRQLYAASPELRESLAEMRRKFKRKPDVRERLKEYFKVRNRSRKQLGPRDLMGRRATWLNNLIRRQQLSRQGWTWKSHTPVLEQDRVDHTYTACGNVRFLKLWWRENLPGKATDANSDQIRYMCNHCFANKWELVVPETYPGKLSRLFTSTDHPPMFRRERLKAEASANEVKKEHEEDPKNMYEKDHKEGRT
ncbi:hypothetical protein E4T44_09276, partial [Aureobasidium sp. EXF-8845]